MLDAVRKHVGPRPAERIPFIRRLTTEVGRKPTHGFPKSLADIRGELKGLKENHRKFKVPADPHMVEDNGYTKIENMLFRMASKVEGD